MATLADFQAAEAAFRASPSEETMRAALSARRALGTSAVTADGVSVQLDNIATLQASYEADLTAARRAAASGKRFVRTGVSHGC